VRRAPLLMNSKTNPKMNVGTLFAAIVFAVIVCLAVLLWRDGTIDADSILGGNAVPVPSGVLPSQPIPEDGAVPTSTAVSENPPPPSDFPVVQATSGTSVSGFVHLPLSEPVREVLGLKIFEMSVNADGFTPPVLVLTAGDRVQLDVSATAGRVDLGIPGLGAYLEVPGGERRSIGFDAAASGTYPFSCRAFCPNGKEISGTVIVR
jgi:heme/copper-type cytochrome/quinol oxidase subunit 2